MDSNLEPEKLSAGIVRKTWMFLSDARYVIDSIDTRFGTRLTPTFDKVSANYNAYNFKIAPLMTDLKNIMKEAGARARALNMTQKEYQEKIGKALYMGDLSVLSEADQKIARMYSSYFEKAADELEKFSREFKELDISSVTLTRKYTGKDKVYYPHYTIEPVEYARRTIQFYDTLPREVKNLIHNIDDVAAEYKSDAIAIKKALESWWGKELSSQEDTIAAIMSMKSFQRGGVSFDLNIQGKSFFERTDEVPAFLINYNAIENAISWTQNMFRYVALRNPLDELRQSAKALDIAAPSFASYIQNYISDLSGTRHGTIASRVQRSFDRFRMVMSDKAKDSDYAWQKTMYTTLGNADQIVRQASSNLYAFYLGGNLQSAIRNIPQTLLITSATVSPTSVRGLLYSYDIAIDSYRQVYKKMKDPAFLNEMKRLGQLPTEQTFEAIQDIKQGILRSGSKFKPTAEVLEGISRASLILYRGTDTVTRATTAIMAERILKDVEKKVPSAIDAILNTPLGYRNQLVSLISKGDYNKAQQLYGDYLLGLSLIHI